METAVAENHTGSAEVRVRKGLDFPATGWHTGCTPDLESGPAARKAAEAAELRRREAVQSAYLSDQALGSVPPVGFHYNHYRCDQREHRSGQRVRFGERVRQ